MVTLRWITENAEVLSIVPMALLGIAASRYATDLAADRLAETQHYQLTTPDGTKLSVEIASKASEHGRKARLILPTS